MAAPSSPAPVPAVDTIITPQHSSAVASSSKPFITPASQVAAAIRSPMLSAQPLIGKPINPPAPPSQPHNVPYPIGTSVHRGFPVRSGGGGRALEHLVSVANPAGYLRSSSPMAVMNFAAAMAAASQSRPYVYCGVEHTAATAAAASHGIRPPHPQEQQQAHHFVTTRPGASRAASVLAHPKVTSLPVPVAPERSETKTRDSNIEDVFVMIHGRKVRLMDSGSGSLYALCRSWIRNGLTQETHPNVGEGVKLLPKPLPPSIVEEMLLNKKVDDKGIEELQEDEYGDSVEQLSSQELLAGHIKHARRVRARFRRERLLRIERYKQRLSLLLPAPNDIGQSITTPGSS